MIPDDSGKVLVVDHIMIKDSDTGEILLNKRGNEKTRIKEDKKGTNG